MAKRLGLQRKLRFREIYAILLSQIRLNEIIDIHASEGCVLGYALIYFDRTVEARCCDGRIQVVMSQGHNC